jgi:uncharacterized protein YwgA
MSKLEFKKEDRVLLIINDNFVQGSTRLQKYGFLLAQEHNDIFNELSETYTQLKFYNDWKPHYYGPFSEELQKDIDTCIKNGLLHKRVFEYTGTRQDKYVLTIKGQDRWGRFLTGSKVKNKINHINSTIKSFQK